MNPTEEYNANADSAASQDFAVLKNTFMQIRKTGAARRGNVRTQGGPRLSCL